MPRCSARRERVAGLGCLTLRPAPPTKCAAAPQPVLECGLTAPGVNVPAVQCAIGQRCLWGDRGRGNPSALAASPFSFPVPSFRSSFPPPSLIAFALIFLSLLRWSLQRLSSADVVISMVSFILTYTLPARFTFILCSVAGEAGSDAVTREGLKRQKNVKLSPVSVPLGDPAEWCRMPDLSLPPPGAAERATVATSHVPGEASGVLP